MSFTAKERDILVIIISRHHKIHKMVRLDLAGHFASSYIPVLYVHINTHSNNLNSKILYVQMVLNALHK